MYFYIVFWIIIIIFGIFILKHSNKNKFNTNVNKLPPIIYINLKSRSDRNIGFVKEMRRIGITNYMRLEAIKNTKGHVGCAYSHLKALQYAQTHDMENVLICEDDFRFHPKFLPEQIFAYISHCMSLCKFNFDVLMITCNTNPKIYVSSLTSSSYLKRVISAYGACAYVVNRSYFPILINIYQNAISKQVPIDYIWLNLQKKNRWYHCVPLLGYQYPSYSDIEKKNVFYTSGMF